MDGSNAFTFEAMITDGIGGRIQTRAEAEPGPELPAGGRAELALSENHPAMAGPSLTVRVTVGVEPSASPGAACGPCVARSADTGMAPRPTTAMAIAAGTCQRKPLNMNGKAPSSDSNGARKRTSANRSAHAMTRLARIAVLVQNSSVVGPRSTTASNATQIPKTTLASCPSGTVLGSGTMNRAKMRISGDATRICQSSRPHMGVTCQLATIQGPIGIHQRSSGSVYFGPSTTKARTSATLEGLKMCRPFHRIRYLVAIPRATTPMKIQIPCVLHHWPWRVPGTRRMKAVLFPVSSPLAGQMMALSLKNVTKNSIRAPAARHARI